jgi:hypothetical protein
MPLLSRLCSVLAILAFVLGMSMPVSHKAMSQDMQDMSVSAVEQPMSADSRRCDDPSNASAVRKGVLRRVGSHSRRCRGVS